MLKPRRALSYAVVCCLAGAGLALLAAGRTWLVDDAGRPPVPGAGGRTGGQLVPWLAPLALVGLAGAGALLATRGTARALVGVLIAACGAGVLAAGAYRLLNPTGDAVAVWPALTVVGGGLLVAGGTVAAWRGRGWPSMGSRYDRRAGPAGDSDRRTGRRALADPTQAWTALDRGEDPTDR